MTLSSAEQFLIELINRGRLDPAADAARYGISLNQGLAAGTISTAAKEVLAPNTKLEAAAIGHSKWMISVDIFSHTGKSGTQPWDRAENAGYTSWSNVGENIAFEGTTGTQTVTSATMLTHYEGLFRSAGHRVNTFSRDYSEIGIGEEVGPFRKDGTNWNAALLTELFGTKGSTVFLTGVAYTDSNDSNFYSVGEGRSGVTFTAQSKTATTASAGGYSLGLSADSTMDISGKVGTKSFTVQVNMGAKNAKLDVVDANIFFTSADIVLKTGISHARLLGVEAIDATGNVAANVLYGNKGANILRGEAGADKLYAGVNNDDLFGGSGNDLLYGSTGADDFHFGNSFGRDTIADFSVSAGDDLYLDDAIWGGAAKTASQIVSQYASVSGGKVILTFSADEVITLTGVTTTSGLSGAIEIF